MSVEERKTVKTKLTKGGKLVIRLMAEGKVEQVQRAKDQLITLFTAFEECHNAIHNQLTKEAEIETSEKYFDEVEDQYVEVLNKAQSWLRDSRKSEEIPKPQPLLSMELAGILNLPKIELEPYDGNPMKYMEFFSLFEESVAKHTSDHQVMLTRLLQYTSGEANDAIRSCSMIGGKEGYEQAMNILESRFGNGDLISENVITSIRSKKAIKTPDEMRKLADGLDNGYIILSRLGKLAEVESQSCIIDIVSRLPAYAIKKWRKIALETKDKVGKYPNFIELVKFIKKEASEALDPVYGHNKLKHLGVSFQCDNFCTTANTLTDSHASGQSRYISKNKCVVCEEPHPIWLCSTFKSMNIKDRSDVVTKHNLCKNCLKINHMASQCRRPSYCTQTGCKTKHSKFLHCDNDLHIPTVENNYNSNKSEPHASLVIDVEDSVNYGQTHVYLPIIPVKVNGNKDTRLALLDTASNTTFCTRKLLRDLNIKGSNVEYRLNTLDQPDVPRQTEIVKMILFSEDGKDSLALNNVFVVDTIPIKNRNVDISSYPHLQNLPISSASSEVDLLIGQDHCEALIPLEIRKGQRGEVYAVRTLFGWSLNGPISTHNMPDKQVINLFITATNSFHGNVVNDKEVLPGDVVCCPEDERVERDEELDNDTEGDVRVDDCVVVCNSLTSDKSLSLLSLVSCIICAFLMVCVSYGLYHNHRFGQDCVKLEFLSTNEFAVDRFTYRLFPSERSTLFYETVFVQKDMYFKRWKYVRFFAEQFWRRWSKEFLFLFFLFFFNSRMIVLCKKKKPAFQLSDIYGI